METRSIKDFIHLHLGCTVYITAESAAFRQDILDTDLLDRLITGSLPIEYYKPILRKLSDMTEEEVANLLDIDINASIIKANFCSPFFQIEYIDDHGENTYEHRYITQLRATQFLYLLSIHIDLFNLIPEGLAIDKSKI